MRKTRVYNIWCQMKSRCNSENHIFYSEYGGRGIKVIKEWEVFINFWDWCVLSGYDDNLSIERLDVNGNYCPENCTWIPRSHQSRNKRKPKNNKTGVVGVMRDGARYRAGLYDENGNYMSKSFSINKYGEESFKMAVDWRRQKLLMLQSFGIYYGENH
jgi:hypothetical protein